MNIQSAKNSAVAVILLGALVMFGAVGAMSPAAAAPAPGTVTIKGNENDVVTDYPQVTLSIVAPSSPSGNVQMQFQNELNVLSLSPWESFAASKLWTLSAGTGVKTVTAKFRDAVSKSALPAVSDSIILDSIIDTSFNAASATYPGSANFANTAAVLSSATAANAVAVYRNAGTTNDGKTVTVGTYDNGNGNTDIKIIRYTTDGVKDAEYYFDMAGKADKGNAVALQSDGKIVVVGTCNRLDPVTSTLASDVCIFRLNSDATSLSPDTGFGVGGMIHIQNSGNDAGNAVAIDPVTGFIVVAGTYETTRTQPFSSIMRFDKNGTLDATFSHIGLEGGPANAVSVQADQKIVVVGTHINLDALGSPDGTTSVWVSRLNSDSTVDTTFNAASTPGFNFFGTAGVHTGNALAIDPVAKKIVVVGTYNGTQAWVIQLVNDGLNDGTLDTSFNYAGSVTLDGPIATSGNGVAIQADGKIVMVGTNDLGGGSSSLLVARLKNSGTVDDPAFLDTTFDDGSHDYAFGSAAKFAGKAVALQPDGKIIIAGIGDAHRLLASIPVGSTSMLTLRLHEKTYPINVTIIGGGTVSAYPGKLTGGSGEFKPGSTITLTATAAPGGATFSGWLVNGSALVCPGTGTCSVKMNAAKNIIATFTESFALNVSVTGAGTVTSSPAGISCSNTSSANCSSLFLATATVTLTTTGAPWYTLGGIWGGACSGSIGVDCVVSMSQLRTVSATFIPNLTTKVISAGNINRGEFPTLTEAYSVANTFGPVSTIQAKNILFPEVMTFNLPVIVTLQGGKGSDFSAAATGFTTITGPLIVTNGRLNAGNVKVVSP